MGGRSRCEIPRGIEVLDENAISFAGKEHRATTFSETALIAGCRTKKQNGFLRYRELRKHVVSLPRLRWDWNT